MKTLATAILIALCSLLAASRADAQVTIAISCSSLGIEFQLCQSGADAWAQKTGNKVKLVPTPSDADERFGLYQTLLSAQSKDVDVFQIDVVWPGALANNFIDLSPYLPKDKQAQFIDVLIRNDTVDGKLIAIPWFVDAGLLYYRKDLLDKYGKKPPQTWNELAATANDIVKAERAAGHPQMQGYVWQGRAYEGLTCNAVEWIASYGGGAIVDASGKVTVDNAAAAKALAEAKSWIGSVSPEGTLGYSEEESRGVFQSGDAVFMRNWPYAWALANAADSPVKDKVGITVLPMGEGDGARHASVLGGQQLAVSRYSAHPKEAADLVIYLTGAAEQKRRAEQGSFNPTLTALYDDKDLLAANPFLGQFRDVLANAVARPSTVTGRRYNQVSSDFFQTVHDTLSGQSDPTQGLKTLADQLSRLSRGGHW